MNIAQRRTRLRAALVWVAAAYVVGIAGQLVTNGLAGRLVGPLQYAHFAAVTSGTILVSQFAVFGLQTAGLRDAASMRERGTDGPLAMENRQAIRSIIRISLPVAGLLGGGLALLLIRPDSPTQSALVVAAVAVIIVLGGQQRLFANYLRGFGEVRLSSLLEGRSGGAILLASQALGLGALSLLTDSASLATIFAISAVACVPASLLGRMRLRQHLPGSGGRWHPWTELTDALRRARGFAGLQVGIFLDTNVDLFISVVVLAAADASYFAAGQRLAVVIVIPNALLGMVTSPVIVRLAQVHDRLQPMIRTAGTIGLVMAAVLAIPLMLLSHEISVLVFGPSFSSAAPIVSLIAVAYLFRVAAGLASVALSMSGLEGVASRVFIVGAVLRCVASGTLGALGGIYAFTLSSIAITILVYGVLWWLARRRLKLNTAPTTRPSLRQFLSIAS